MSAALPGRPPFRAGQPPARRAGARGRGRGRLRARLRPESPAARRVYRREHPDLMVAAPERRRRVNPPPFEETEGKETTLPTALVRAVAADATRLPYEAPRRAVVLLDVDRTESAAFSALLKILEEPPTKTRFILTATRPRLLPSTILSRVALRPVPGCDARPRRPPL